jgi:outer membrane protein OmpA-like peptidoglycan-associated protein
MGRRTLLDLLAAQNDLISAKKQIVNAKYDLLFAKYRILDAMGVMVQEIIGDTDDLYSRVGLGTQDLKYEDTIPVHLDNDNDLVSDNQDICQNSDSKIISDLYGCEDKTKVFNRSTTVYFDDKELQEESKKSLENFISNYKKLDLTSDIFIVSHVAQSSDDEKDMDMSIREANYIRNYMLDQNISGKNIVIKSKGSNEPLWTQEKDEGVEKNHRTDIILMDVLDLKETPKAEVIDTPKSIEEEVVIEKEEAPVIFSPASTEVTETDSMQNESIENESIQDDVTGPIIIVGTFNNKKDAEKFSKKFKNLDDSEPLIEFTKNHYNVKLLINDESKIKSTLTKAKEIVPDAWYAGVQTVVVDR